MVQGLESGGPYTIDVRHIGFVPHQLKQLYLALGERRDVAFTLIPLTTSLDTVRIATGNASTSIDAAGGVGTLISDSTLRRLPTLNGDMYDFVRMVPQVGTRFGLSGAGASFRFNNLVIDGVSDRQLQGNNAPGGANSTKSISLDAVKEYQVLLSPFDPRYGDFAGLLVNAVTKSGTNVLHGSAYAYVRDAQLARSGSFLGTSAYDRELYGLSIGGPIVRDRVHFFVAAEMQRATAPARGPYVGQPVDGTPSLSVLADNVTRFAALLRDRGIDPGDGRRVMLPNPNTNGFGRVDVALPELKSRLVLRGNFSRTEFTQFQRRESANPFPLSSVATATRVEKQTTAAQLFTQLSPSAFNEFRAGYSTSPLISVPYAIAPSILVTADGVQLVAGPAGGTSSGARQVSAEMGDHLSFRAVSNHTIGLGAHVEFFRYHVVGFRNGLGQWIFPSLDALANGAASSYTIGKDFGSAEAPVNGTEPSAYVSDEWRLSDRLSLTFGLRMDALTVSGMPAYNPAVDTAFRRRTSDFPSMHPQWSPRFGFTWEPNADRRTSIRGGAGIFVGRPPIGWLVGPMRSNGAGVRMLRCAGRNISPFTPYPAAQPATCTDGSGPSTGPVTLVDRNLRMAESFRTSLTVERRLPRNVTGKVEGLYSKVRSDFLFSNVNLRGPVGVDSHGRVMYGAILAGVAQPSRVDAAFPEVTDLRNQSGGDSWSLTGEVYKPWSDYFAMSASYTHSRVRDVQSVTNSSVAAPLDIWATERPISGRWDDRSTGVSSFEIPHRVVVSATYAARWKRQTTDISLSYIGESGSPFTYGDSTAGTFSGDLNADGTSADDPIYVPRDATDPSEIVFAGGGDSAAVQGAAFERFIRDTPCLQHQRGRIIARNSCRGSWVNTSNVSVRQSLPPIAGHRASIQLEVFNVLNLLNPSWGLLKVPNPWILQYAGQTTGATPQHMFRFGATAPNTVQNAESSYQLQLSLRYVF
jgi:hypothetical protein